MGIKSVTWEYLNKRHISMEISLPAIFTLIVVIKSIFESFPKINYLTENSIYHCLIWPLKIQKQMITANMVISPLRVSIPTTYVRNTTYVRRSLPLWWFIVLKTIKIMYTFMAGQ